jgi:cytochrome P450
MRVVLGRVLERTELQAVRRRPERVQRQGITLVPRDGVRVRLVSRRP